MNKLNYEIVNIHYQKDDIWGHLINKNLEKFQQLVLIAPLKEIFDYLKSL